MPDRIGFGIEAAHHLPFVPQGHQCRRLHGHSYRIEVGAEKLDALEERLRDIYAQLDHTDLNEIDGLENPTSEHLSRWIWDCLRTGGTQPTVVAIQETCTAGCVYRGE
ncbi:MAG: 6-pyruvoyl trahydropterin synthase family protein [Candidatus Hydrogenedentota bacterium]